MSNQFNEKDKGEDHRSKFFTFRSSVFTVSIIFLVIALISVYSIYTDGKAIEENANKIVKNFNQTVFELERSNLQTEFGAPVPIDNVETRTSMYARKEKIDPDEGQQLVYTPAEGSEIEYKTVAKLNIEKIGLKAPVISEWSYELLDISVNKFSGPEPNEPGNFVIIGHNYLNGTHFGSLHLLEMGDQVNLTDLSGRMVTYEVYEILTVKPDEIDKITTYENRTLTLITCDKSSELRLIVKCKDNS